MSVYDVPPVGGRWRPANAPRAGRELAEKPSRPSTATTGGKEVTETKTTTRLPEGDSERARLERSTGLPLTHLTEEEWDRVRDEATKAAAEKLHVSYGAGAAHYPEYIREGYEKAIKGSRPSAKRGARGIRPGSAMPKALLADESWMSPGHVDLSESHHEDRRKTRAVEAYAFEHGMSFNEAARYVV